MALLRLDRMLSGQGVGTRREIKDMLKDGAVTINGAKVKRADIKVDTSRDCIFVCGTEIVYKAHIYIMMNKPSGVISATEDPREKTVIDLLPPSMRRPGLFPVGRLDRDTQGLLIITDDGNFAHEVLSPRKHVAKQYIAVIDSPTTPEQRYAFENRLTIDGNYTCLPAKIEVLDSSSGTLVRVTICEGKYHQVKRMFHAIGKSVISLKRVSMGQLSLDRSLTPGQVREISAQEIAKVVG